MVSDGLSLESQFEWVQFKGAIYCEPPNDKVNDFIGQIQM